MRPSDGAEETAERSGARLRACLGAAAVVLIALVLFSRVLRDPFLSDDYILLRGLRDGGPFGALTRGGMFFRPFAALSLWLDLRVFGLHPLGFHVVNVLLHATATMALFCVAQQLGSSALSAGIAAAWFLVSPTHSEPVAWISCRMDLLAAAAGLCGVSAWLGSRHGSPRAQALRLALAMGLLSCALLSKEAAAPLCLILAAWEILRAKQASVPSERRAALLRLVLVAALLPIYLTVRRLALGQWVGGYSHVQGDPVKAAKNVVVFTARALTGHFPAEYVPLQRPLYGVFDALAAALRARPLVLAGLAVLALLLIPLGLVVLRRLRSDGPREPLGFPLLAYGLALLPVLSLDVSLVMVEGERFLYLPSAFLLLTVAALLVRLVPRLRPRVYVAGTIAALYILSLRHALRAWNEAGSLAGTLLPEVAAARARGPLTLLNMPDCVRGAYVFRNGLSDALDLFYGLRGPVPILVSHVLVSATEPVHVELSPGRIVVRPGDPRSFIYGAEPPPDLTAVQEPDGNGVEIRGPRPARLYSYSAGHLRAIE